MFVGDKGKIIGGFRGEKPVLYAGNKKILPEKQTLKMKGRTGIIPGSTPSKTKHSHPEVLFMQGLLPRQFSWAQSH